MPRDFRGPRCIDVDFLSADPVSAVIEEGDGVSRWADDDCARTRPSVMAIKVISSKA
jgi:hypothetical protein